MPEPSNPNFRSGQSVALAWDFFGTIAAGSVIGWLVDRQLGSEPWALTGLTLLAVAGGFVRLVKELRRLDRPGHDE